MDIIQEVEKEQLAKLTGGRRIPEFRPGDTIRVNVKVVVAGSVSNRNWTALARQLNRRTGDASYARRCTGGCRSASKIMHSKIFLFSRIGRARAISMYGSSNLTTPAGNRQWNDLVTLRSLPTYRVLRKTFEEYARDRAIRPAYRTYSTPPLRTWYRGQRPANRSVPHNFSPRACHRSS